MKNQEHCRLIEEARQLCFDKTEIISKPFFFFCSLYEQGGAKGKKRKAKRAELARIGIGQTVKPRSSAYATGPESMPLVYLGESDCL